MKLVSFQKDGKVKAGVLIEGQIYPFNELDDNLPGRLLECLQDWGKYSEMLRQHENAIKAGEVEPEAYRRQDLTLLAPLPSPVSLRDAYAFRQHVKTARANRGASMIPEFDQFPVFYFTNHNAVYGPGPVSCMPDHFRKLDYELEVAVVIGKAGKNIRAEEADKHIAGYMIMNDLSARQLQKEEMKLNLGPAKGKDFANVLGPVMVTPDELSDYKTEPPSGHTGVNYDLTMKAFVNGEQISEGNMGVMDWTFAEIIERVSYGTPLYPGEVIGSGTVGTGCLLEVNGTRRRENPDYKSQWLQPGDEVRLEIEKLGALQNTLEQEDTDYSLLDLKKETQETKKS